MADNAVIVELNGRLVGDGYTLPIATPTRLGVIMVGDRLTVDTDGVLSADPEPIATAKSPGVIRVGQGLSIDANGILTVDPVEHNAFSKLIINYINGAITKIATTRNDAIDIGFEPAFKVKDVDGVPTISLNFGTIIDSDKPMSGAAIREYVNSEIEGLEFEFEGLIEWLANLYIAANAYIATETHEITTDSSGYATLPFTPEDNQTNYIFINGLFAVEGKDYQITDNVIQLTSSDFVSGEDVITFVVFNSVIDGETGESKPINISDEIYETVTGADGYAPLPFTYDNQMLHVFINGVLATNEIDYSIVNDNSGIQVANSEFATGEDIVTFVVLKATDDVNMSTELYEVEADGFGRANIPIIPKMIIKKFGSTAVRVYINNMLATVDKDYIIENGKIQLTSLSTVNDIITFEIYKTEVIKEGSGGTTDDLEITISDIDEVISEIEEFNN